MADSATITSNVADGSSTTGNVVDGVSITSTVNESTTVTASVVTGGSDIVQSVNTYTGAVVLDPDDLDDTSTINKFVTAADITNLGNLSGTNTGDQDLSTYQLKPTEGAFANGDKTKLDGIEALADVTDTTSVTAAGALMDSELADIASVKALNQGVATTDSPSFAGATLTGAAPALYLTESDQVSPAGAYRIDSSGDELRFVRSSTVLGKFTSTQFDLSNVALLLDASSNSEGLIAKSGATHIFSLYRQATPSNASAVLSAYGGIGFATGATGGAATSGFKLTIDTTGNTYPGTDSAQTLGTSSLYWSNTYTDVLTLNATASLSGATAGVVTFTGAAKISSYFELANGSTFQTAREAIGSNSLGNIDIMSRGSIKLYLDSNNNGTTDYLSLFNDGSSSEVLRINPSGDSYINTGNNLGIGTTAPSDKLHVNVGNVEGLRVESSNSGFIEIGKTSFNRWRWANDYNGTYLELLYGASGATPTNSRLTVDSSGNVGIGTAPTEALDVNGDAIRIRTSQTPASASATGTAGMVCWDSSYIYVCTATDIWVRAALSTW